ncbi:MAG: SdpI family protein [Candidatus Roizmanbacteria bacterium]|nr:SdpI family protein [Candidatus Roizmanbacteria bacterium]
MLLFQIILIVIQFVASLYLYSSLPHLMPTHWNIYGNIDSYMPKQYAVWMFPFLGLIMLFFFKIAPSFDPNKNKYQHFSNEWQILQAVFVVFFAYMQGITFYVAYNPTLVIMKPMFIGLGTLFILLGNYLSKIRQNYFIGIKVPWTLASEDNWNKTHRFASWTFVIAGIIVLVEAFFIWQAAPIVFGSLMLGSFLPVLYSYLLFKNKEHYMKRILLGIICIATLLIGIRTISGEDDWICKDGKWVIHGKPSTARPTTQCIKR